MKFIITVLISAISLVGCKGERIEGQLNVTKNLSLTNSTGMTKDIDVGTYSADIKANTSKKITLRLNNNSDDKFVFNHNGNIPDSGTFNIPSKVSGQPVDLSGAIATSITLSQVRETIESCTYQMPVEVCYPSPYGGMSCTIQYRIIYGNQWVRYYDRTVTKNVNLSVKASGTDEESADFHGDITDINRVVLSQGICR